MTERAGGGDQSFRGRRELVERHAEPVVDGDLGGEFVVAAAQVPDEGMPGSQGPRGLLRSGRIFADGGTDEIKAEAGIGRTVRFQSLTGPSERFRQIPEVTAVHADGNHITLVTANADATVWALYDIRDTIASLAVTDAGLQEAFLALTSAADLA